MNTSSNKIWLIGLATNNCKQILTAASKQQKIGGIFVNAFTINDYKPQATPTTQKHTTTKRTTISTGVLTYDSRLQVDKHSSGNVFPGARFTEEGVEGVVSSTDGFVGGHLPVWLYAMLQTVELPTGIANLHSSLSNVDGDTLTLK